MSEWVSTGKHGCRSSVFFLELSVASMSTLAYITLEDCCGIIIIVTTIIIIMDT